MPLSNAPVAIDDGDQFRFECRYDTTKATDIIHVCVVCAFAYEAPPAIHRPSRPNQFCGKQAVRCSTAMNGSDPRRWLLHANDAVRGADGPVSCEVSRRRFN